MGTETLAYLSVDYLQPRRPWLSLYGVRLRPKKAQEESEIELSAIQTLLPEEVMLQILLALGPYTLGKAACVCRQWRQLSEHSRLWEPAVKEAFQSCNKNTVHHLNGLGWKELLQKYSGSWKRIFLEHPHLRFDGIYAARNTYLKAGVVEWKNIKTTHIVLYFRYYRFFPDGTFLYRTTPQVVSKVAKSMRKALPKHTAKSQQEGLLMGRYVMKEDTIYCQVVYPNSRMTEIRSRLRLRSTHAGANNRLDILEIYTFDRELDTRTPFTHGGPEDDPDGEGSRKDHRRGLAPCAFVPWESVQTSVLNLPIQQMDVYIPG